MLVMVPYIHRWGMGKQNAIPGDYEGVYEPLHTETIDQSSGIGMTEVGMHMTPFNQITTMKYKAFSNSLNIPPIEQPIILNPNYNDALTTKLKQPINGQNFKDAAEIKSREKELAVKIIINKLKDVQSHSKGQMGLPRGLQMEYNKNEADTKFKTKRMEVNKEEKVTSDFKREDNALASIKYTAFNVIDENIKKAVNVAEEIKKEIDIELARKELIASRKTKATNIENKSTPTMPEERARTLGLQTISYIKTYMDSQFLNRNIMTRIFFELTKFMVSLSQRIFKKNYILEEQYTSRSGVGFYENEAEYYEEKILSGAEMSRKFGKTPLEFTERMDTVITEFEAKSGIEITSKKRRSSRSRSRSRPKEQLNGDLKNQANIEGNVYRAFVTEEWSEYYDLGKPEINTTMKSEKHFESESMKKETIEELFEEKILQKDVPLTYIAIVQAHVFTNQNAIIRDDIEIEKDMKISEKIQSMRENIVLKKMEETATCTDLQHQVIQIKKEKPIEKVVVIESIEDITPVEEYKLFPGIEKALPTPIQKTTVALEPVTEMEHKQPHFKQAREFVENCSIIIPGSQAVVLQAEKDNSFTIPEIKPRKSITLFEGPLKTVAETTRIDTLEPRVEVFETITKPLVQTASTMEEPKVIANVAEVQVIEAASRPLHLKISQEEKSKQLIETPIQSVAVKTETYIDQPKVEFTETPPLKMEETKVLLEPLTRTAAETSEIYTERADTFPLYNPDPAVKQVRPTIEPFVQVVAAKAETYINESSVNLAKTELRSEVVQTLIEQPIKAAAETFETSVNTAEAMSFKTDITIGENTRTLVEVPKQIVAQVGIVCTDVAEGVYKQQKAVKGNIKSSIETSQMIVAQSLETAAEEEKVKLLDNFQVKKESLIPSIESNAKNIAETNFTISSETNVEFEATKINKVTTLQTLEPMKTVAENMEVYVIDVSEDFDKFKVKSTERDFSIETPIRIIADKNEIEIDEAVGVVENVKLIEEKPQSNIEMPFRTTMTVSTAFINESSGVYEKENTIEQKRTMPHTSLEMVFRSVPETSEITLNESNTDIIATTYSGEKPKSVMETPIKAVAEKFQLFVNTDEIKTFESKKSITEKSNAVIENPVKVLAQKSIVIPDEPKLDSLQIAATKMKSSKIVMEDTVRFVPEVIIPGLEEPRTESLIIPKPSNEEAKVALDKLKPTIITEILLAEPNQLPFESPEFKTKIPRPLIEKPVLTVPEIMMTILEGPKYDNFIVPKTTEEVANAKFKSSEATSVTEISFLEPQCDSFEVPQVTQRQSQRTLEEAKLTLPKTEIHIALGPKDDNMEIQGTIKQKAKINFNELKALETYVISPEEAALKAVEYNKLQEKKSNLIMEGHAHSVSESIQVNVAESEKSFSVLSEAIGQEASLTVQSLVGLSQTAIAPIEEVNIVDENFQTTKSRKVVETELETLEKHKASINKIDVKESKVDITEVTNDIEMSEDISAAYSVELAKDEIHEEKSKVENKVLQEESHVHKLRSIKKQEKVSAALELDTKYIHKDIEYIENGMESIIQSIDEKDHKRSIIVSESKIIHSGGSKSPSPDSPINDVYFFNVATQYKHERETEEAFTELEYRSAAKRPYTQAETSVEESIAIQYPISDSDEDIQTIEENDYESYESNITAEAMVKHKMSHMRESKESESAQKRSKLKRGEAKTILSSFESNTSTIEQRLAASQEMVMVAKQGKSESMKSVQLEANTESLTDISASILQVDMGQQESVVNEVSSSKILEAQRHSAEIGMGLQETSVKSKSARKSAKSKRQSALSLEQNTAKLEMRALEEHRRSIEQNINTMETNIEEQYSILSKSDDIVKSPSPPIQPPTPLTDEYVFRLTAPLPSREGTPVPRDCTSSSESEEEIRRKLIPHIELSIEQRIFDPPLPTPPTSPTAVTTQTDVTSPVRRKPLYSKPGLRGGGDTWDLTKEEILEISRQSNLLASAIDKTLKSIEEYKSEFGISNMEYGSETVTSSQSEIKEISTLIHNNKVDVLIDKMVETSRRFSGDSERDGAMYEGYNNTSREVIIPVATQYVAPRPQTAPEDNTEIVSYPSKLQTMEQSRISEQLLKSIESMVDPNAGLEDRLSQMQAQISELSRLPDIISRTLDEVKVQFEQLSYQVQQTSIEQRVEVSQSEIKEVEHNYEMTESAITDQPVIEVTLEEKEMGADKKEFAVEEHADVEIQRIIEKRRLEAESKAREEIMRERLSQELRTAAERLSPKLSFDERPKFGVTEYAPTLGVPQETPKFGVTQEPLPEFGLPQEPLPAFGVPQESPYFTPPQQTPRFGVSEKLVKQDNAGQTTSEAVKPVGKVWKKSDNYDDANLEQMLSETMAAQAEVIKGKAIGVNFMKYEKPPPPLDHLLNSEVYKAIHEMDQKPLKKVELLKPAIAASDYVERLRSVSPAPAKTLIEDCEV
ncbi:unnamed protein product [Leptosia nina]|uniref:Uncharacterized protein n=1 Tax=Leptosia nina TaxID=320188 RepID=A0AAV1JV90_9NEOP